MSKPKCIIVTGRPGSGKSTLSRKLSRRLWMPIISRDEIKEGYVNTFGVNHDQLPPDTNGIVTGFFFDIVCQYLSNKISIIIEAAFQHALWESQMPRIVEVSDPFIIICSINEEMAAKRHLERGLADAGREFYHGDAHVAIYRATGEIAPPDQYIAPDFDLPTLRVSTESDYSPSLDEIAQQIWRGYAPPNRPSKCL